MAKDARDARDARIAKNTVSGEVGDLYGDVVGAPTVFGEVNQALAGVGGIGMEGFFVDFLVSDLAPQAIRAENDDRTGSDGHRFFRIVGGHGLSGTKSGGKNVALGMGLGLFRLQQAVFDQTADIGMIASEASDAVTGGEVDAAITDVGVIELAAEDSNGGAGGAHAVKFRMTGRVVLNAAVGDAESLIEPLVRPSLGGLGVDMFNGFDGNAAGFLATLIATHAVGDEQQASLASEGFIVRRLPVCKPVFIILALTTDIGKTGIGNPGPKFHFTSNLQKRGHKTLDYTETMLFANVAMRFFRFSERAAGQGSRLLFVVRLRTTPRVLEFPLTAAQFVVQGFDQV